MSIQIVVGVAVVGAFLLWLLMRSDDRIEMPRTAHAGVFDSVESALHAGRKIEAIKLYREEHGVGLKEAKEAVESVQRSIGSV